MPFNTRELIEAAEVIVQQENMKVNLQTSLKGATFTGISTFIGGIFGGPIGLAVGATLGGLSSMWYTRGQFKPVILIIREDMSVTQRNKFAQHLQNSIKDLDITDAIKLATLVLQNPDLFMALKYAIVQYFEKDLHMMLAN
ncbi:protein C19orf12 homolog isoform X4 [Cimex lectularius]|uniref:Uncharacterized protein n=1 Tax=Cimex lectularius TaxID=79782 RepID=A0A8I6RIQ4_CIMLE|nr:protein C19orf12 homolog isoform X4 [Cimex lectularius]